MSDPLANAPPDSPFHPVVVISASPPPHDPPPPYPSQERRTRAPRAGRRRRTLEQASESASQGLAISSGGTELQHDAIPPTIHQQFESDEQDGDATETTPLLGPSGSSPRVPVRLPAGIMGRQRTLSLTSTVRSTHSVAPSLAQTVLSAFNPERDCDVDADCDDPHQDSSESSQSTPLDSPLYGIVVPWTTSNVPSSQNSLGSASIGGVISPGLPAGDDTTDPSANAHIMRLSSIYSYSTFLMLSLLGYISSSSPWCVRYCTLCLNVPSPSLQAGTTTLMALPLGAVLCFIDLIGARLLSRGEVCIIPFCSKARAVVPPRVSIGGQGAMDDAS